MQVIPPAAPLRRCRWCDLSGLPRRTREAEAAAPGRRRRRGGRSTWRAGPLLRARAAAAGRGGARAAADHAPHRLATAGRMGVLVRELAALYAAFVDGRAVAAARSCRCSTPTSRSGSAAGCRARCWSRSSPTGAQQLAGRAAAAGAAHRPAAARRARRFRGAPRARAPAAPSCRERLQALWRRREGATLFMMLLAAFQALLAPLRRAGRRASWARPIAGRTAPEIEGLIGFFVNTLVLRARPARATRPSASCWAGCARPTLGAYAHQDLPFEQLVEELQPEREPAPLAAVPGDVRPAERARCGAWTLPGPAAAAAATPTAAIGEVRPDADR